jgi:hypothetical protein
VRGGQTHAKGWFKSPIIVFPFVFGDLVHVYLPGYAIVSLKISSLTYRRVIVNYAMLELKKNFSSLFLEYFDRFLFFV